MPLPFDSARLPEFVSWWELQHQQAVWQLATMKAMGVPAVSSYSASLRFEVTTAHSTLLACNSIQTALIQVRCINLCQLHT